MRDRSMAKSGGRFGGPRRYLHAGAGASGRRASFLTAAGRPADLGHRMPGAIRGSPWAAFNGGEPMTLKLIALCFLGLAAVAAGGARAANPIVVIETSMGNIKVELYEDKAPITVKNFLGYVDDKFYDGTIFHRVIGKENSGKDFMVQGGGFEPGMKEKRKTKDPIKNEASNGLQNKRGTLAMARTGVVDSATAQFFINVADNSF